MIRTCLVAAAVLALLGCPSPDDNTNNENTTPALTLEPEPAGAPTEPAAGRLTCLGGPVGSATSSTLELTGYVRTLADPNGDVNPPAAGVEVFDSADKSVGSAFSDPVKSGRVSVTVPVKPTGFDGYAIIDLAGHLGYRFATSRAITDTTSSAWAWMVTQAEADTRATDVGVTLEAGKGVLVGAVHDCDGFGVEFAVVTIAGETDAVLFIEGFEVTSGRTFTNETGRFVVPNLTPGKVLVRAWGRLDAGGALTLLSEIEAVVKADALSAVSLEPQGAAE